MTNEQTEILNHLAQARKQSVDHILWSVNPLEGDDQTFRTAVTTLAKVGVENSVHEKILGRIDATINLLKVERQRLAAIKAVNNR